MTSSRFAFFLLPLLLFVSSSSSQPPPAERVKADEEILRNLDLSVDGPALVEFFRSRTPREQDRKAISELIRDLGNDRFTVREKATQKLLAIGPPAVPALKESLAGPDLEVVCRAKRCLAVIEKSMTTELVCAAARLIAHKKPNGAVKALLDYLPNADSESVVDQVRATL